MYPFYSPKLGLSMAGMSLVKTSGRWKRGSITLVHFLARVGLGPESTSMIKYFWTVWLRRIEQIKIRHYHKHLVF